eukprot:5289104-Pleurochrysis_carterae.AAC.2
MQGIRAVITATRSAFSFFSKSQARSRSGPLGDSASRHTRFCAPAHTAPGHGVGPAGGRGHVDSGSHARQAAIAASFPPVASPIATEDHNLRAPV